MDDREGICGDRDEVMGVWWVWKPCLPVTYFGGRGSLASPHFCQIVHLASSCMPKERAAHSVVLTVTLPALWNTPVTLFLLPEGKMHPVIEDVWFWGVSISMVEENYPPQKDVQLEQKGFSTPFLMFEKIKIRRKQWGMFHFPVNCTSIYLPYLVCYILYVHTALQQNVILKI